MYRFALRPAWLLSHLFVVVLVVALVNLGFWQLRRLDERHDRNDDIAARSAEPAAPLLDVLASVDEPDEAEFRPVRQEGEYERDGQLLIDNRSLDGLPGAWVVAPLRLADGTLVAVNRGFLAFGAEEDVEAPPPPRGVVEVTGIVVPFVSRSCGSSADESGRAVRAACLQRGAVESAAGAPVADAVIQASSSAPPDDPVLAPVPRPELGEGPHLSYAVQWFIFATIATGGYVLILRKNARERSADRPR